MRPYNGRMQPPRPESFAALPDPKLAGTVIVGMSGGVDSAVAALLLQRDLSDSTVLRNLGVAIGHSVLSYGSLEVGLGKIELDQARAAEDLDRAWEVLGEAVQTVMRAHGIPEAYDRLKSFTRGRPINKDAMREFIASLDLPPAEKERLLRLEPKDYVGLAPILAKRTRGS